MGEKTISKQSSDKHSSDSDQEMHNAHQTLNHKGVGRLFLYFVLLSLLSFILVFLLLLKSAAPVAMDVPIAPAVEAASVAQPLVPAPAAAAPSLPNGSPAAATSLPNGFVYVSDIIEDAQIDIRYYSAYNFVGARIDGYESPQAILTREAALALKSASDILATHGYGIKIFDAYRPQRAVDHFIRWSQDPADTKMKAVFYPDLDKSVLFSLGFIARKSGHSRGSTLDLSLVKLTSGQEVDMGSSFDFFGEISHHGTKLITSQQERRRNILRDAMTSAGFAPYSKEWWHYRLINEPFPDQYFNFLVR